MDTGMRDYLNKLPEAVQGFIRLAGETAVSRKTSVYLVGGFVRDLLIGVNNLDLDFVVESDAIAFAESMNLSLKARLTRHKRFGTATITTADGFKMDFATSRTESYPGPAHLPVVSPGLLKDDLRRRDFTINAMAIEITPSGFGRLIDFFGGKEDLKNRKVRVLHDSSFIDDPTRILRAVRFEQRYGFNIERHTFELLKDAASRDMLSAVQPQRTRDELVLLLKEKEPVRYIRRMDNLYGFKFLHPGFKINKTTFRLLSRVSVRIRYFRNVYAGRRHLDAWLIYLSAILMQLEAREINSFCRKFGFTSGETKRILSCKTILPRLRRQLFKKGIRPSRIYRLLEPLSYEAIVFMDAKYAEATVRRRISDFLSAYNGIKIHINGEDLKKLGLKPGPDYQKIFSLVLNARIDGRVKTRDEELCLIKNIVKIK